MPHLYLVALGSNRRHYRHGRPRSVLRAAMRECASLSAILRHSTIFASAPMGPAQRRFANAACVIESEYPPLALLAGLKRVERAFGRRPGQRWGDRVLDLDIVLWNGGRFRDRDLTIPHPDFRRRSFVLNPAAQIAPEWRDPITGLTLRQLDARLTARCLTPARSIPARLTPARSIPARLAPNTLDRRTPPA